MERDRLKNIPDGLDVVNIGSGPSLYDFDWSAVPEIKGYNLAVSPEDFRYDARMIRNYGYHLKTNGIAIIVICPLSFAENEYLYRDSFSEKYVGLLPQEDVDLPVWKYMLYRTVPSIVPAKNTVIRYIQAVRRRIKSAEAPSGRSRPETKPVSGVSALVNGWIKDNQYLKDLKDPSQADYYKDTFRRKRRDLMDVADGCFSQGLFPVLLLPPMSSQLWEYMSQEFVRRFVYDNLSGIQARGIPLLDYMDDGRFQESGCYDNNGLFLNKATRKQFTRIVWNDIRKIDQSTRIYRKGNRTVEMEKNSDTYVLRNSVKLPYICFGTGVIWKYTRSPILFLKYNIREVLSSIKHRKWNRELYGNTHINGILEAAYASGFRFYDTGRIYGRSEKAIGKEVASNGGVLIATKCSAMDVERRYSPMTVSGNLDQSLKNLKREKADLLLLHWPEGKHWVEYYARIVEEYHKGRCRAFGACNMELEHLKKLEEAGMELPMVLQTEIHPLNTNKEILEYCRKHQIQLMAHTPTGRLNKDISENRTLQEISGKYGKSAVQVILRWHYQNRVIPVVSCFSKEHMEENTDILDFSLTDDEMRLIDGMNRNQRLLDARGIDDPNYIYND